MLSILVRTANAVVVVTGGHGVGGMAWCRFAGHPVRVGLAEAPGLAFKS